MQIHRHLQDLFHSLLANAFAEVNQLAWLTRKLPLKITFPAKILHVGILLPRLTNPFVGQVFQLLQEQ